ncbi:MAG: ABC transporter ATP-binding protein [Bacteriovoracaceae bacterium]|nr:ABC transporter ATP-binding protein [Bacteriovoracaceae bacterium]
MTPIEVSNLSFSYGKKNILTDVSFSIERGDFSYIVGRNGSGKSTLVQLLLGLIQPTSGEIKIFGLPPKKGRSLIGYTPQHMQFDPQFPATVRDVIATGRLRSKKFFYNKEDRYMIDQTLEKIELKEFMDDPFSSLSGGQRQRTLIGRSLVSNPQLLILDEPTSNIDEYSEKRLFETLKQLNEDLPIVMVSHDLYFTQERVNKVICIHKNQIAVHDTCKIPQTVIDELRLGNIRKIDHDEWKRARGHND